MNFIRHSDLIGQHAFLGASKWHWVNYDNEKLIQAYKNSLAQQRGTELHDFACQCIRLKEKLPPIRRTLNMYVNDSLKHSMVPEQPLYYSRNCFGTADAISFDEKKELLKIFDLKTGTAPAHIEQLQIYSALFCLEYRIPPSSIGFDLRIYQNNDIQINRPNADEIDKIMHTIVRFDEEIEKLKLEE